MTDNTNTKETVQKNRFTSAVSVTIILLFMALILTPAVLLITTGEDKTVLDGEKQHTAPAFALSDFLSAQFQNDFELWFSTKYPLRGNFVTAYRQLQFDSDNIGFNVSMLFVPSVKDEETAAETTAPAETVEGEETAAPEPAYSDFNPLYAHINKMLYERTAKELSGYKGTDQVVIGKSGYCYENGYINELYGYSPKYRDCTDEYLKERADKLDFIQEELARRGIAFTVIITPSKASEYEQYIPDWYKAQNTEPDGYVRPVTRLLTMLDERNVNVIDCASYYDEIGLDETFPLTGIHWNKPAAYEATRALMTSYEEQTGTTVRNILAAKINRGRTPPGFGNGETDIFNIAYSGLSTASAITDDVYYWPEITVENEEADKINILIQGGSFCWDFNYYMETYGLTRRLHRFYYNGWSGNPSGDPFQRGDDAWETALKSIDYVVFECNEQFVCMMGTNAPRWGAADKEPLGYNGNDVYESLYNYLKKSAN